jgi:23S rRNA (guanosine2251-2'-O)-methyltransferase
MSDRIVGRQPVLEALKSRQPIDAAFIQHGATGGSIGPIRKFARDSGIPLKEVGKERIQELAGDLSSQGVVAIVSTFGYAEVDEILAAATKRNDPPLLLVLDEIEDPHNLGALIRTAECAGFHGVIIPKHRAASVTAAAIKASAGATAHIPIARVTNIVQTLNELKSSGVWIVGMEMEGAQPYTELDYSGPLAVVIGNEGRGLRRLVKERCDFLATIPMHGKIESLNASVAGALVMFEAARTRNKKKGG